MRIESHEVHVDRGTLAASVLEGLDVLYGIRHTGDNPEAMYDTALRKLREFDDWLWETIDLVR